MPFKADLMAGVRVVLTKRGTGSFVVVVLAMVLASSGPAAAQQQVQPQKVWVGKDGKVTYGQEPPKDARGGERKWRVANYMVLGPGSGGAHQSGEAAAESRQDHQHQQSLPHLGAHQHVAEPVAPTISKGGFFP
jgi:hypothetical protein